MSKQDILPGYQLHIESWEGDADNYHTTIQSGLSEEEVRFKIRIASAFGYYLHSPMVCGAGENKTSDLVDLWREAAKEYPDIAKKYYSGDLPTPDQIKLYDEFHNLSWNDPKKEDEKYSPIKLGSCMVKFMDTFYEFCNELLDYPSEVYCDLDNYFRACDSIKVFYVPGSIEDVTAKFI